jgi:peptidase inhibitor I9
VNLKPQGYDLIAIIVCTAMVFGAALMLQSILVLERGNAQNDLTSPSSNGMSGNHSLPDLAEAETYIISLKNQTSSADLDDIIKSVEEKGANVTHVYSHSIIGFSVQIPQDKKTEIMYSLVTDMRVNNVEPDQTMNLAPPLE